MEIKKIAVLGGGNLGASIAKGLLKSKAIDNKNLVVSEKRPHRITYLQDLGYNVTNDSAGAINDCQVIIVSVKPQQIFDLIKEIKPKVDKNKQLLISTVTGTDISEIENQIGKMPIFRIMPNTAIEINESMTCVSYKNTNKEQEEAVIKLFNKLGKSIVIDESLMSAATVLGACGIAFALRFLRAASQGGIEIGFSSEMSQLITAQTIKGASELILESGNHPEREIDKVTTPQGFTISGLNEMEHQGFSSALIKGLITSYNKLVKFQTKK